MAKITPPASKVFLISCACFLFIGAILLSIFNKGFLVLLLNDHHTPFLDQFFKLFTNLGLGGLLAILAVAFLFIRFYYSILITASLICAGLFTFVLKQLVFTHIPRPTKFFEPGTLSLINGVNYHHWGSFPSGHTMTAFAGSFILTIILKDKQWGFVFFLIALLVAISRVYLCQHFFMDAYAGAFIGTAYTFALHYILGYKLGCKHKAGFNSNLLINLGFRKHKRIEVDVEPAS